MSKDTRVADRLGRGADALRFDADAALDRFHGSRARRQAVRRGRTIVVALLVAALGLAGAWVLQPDDDPGRIVSDPEPAGTIAYTVVTRDGDGASLATSPIGSATPSVMPGGPFAVYAQWSPDGSKVAYVAGPDYDNLELIVADADGTNARTVGQGIYVEVTFSWSPDGTELAYVRGDELPNGFDVVAIVGADGTGDREVVRGVAWQYLDWSPDGERLVLTGHPPDDGGMAGPQDWDLYTVRVDGTDLVQLTETLEWEHFARWSPDGRRIAFTRTLDSSDDFDYASDVWVIDADGTNARQLTDWSGFDAAPVWSPDGRWIAFASDRDATPEQQAAFRDGDGFAGVSTFVMAADGTDVRRVLTAGDGELLVPSGWRN
jgi:Tol biopolymer transport system component